MCGLEITDWLGLEKTDCKSNLKTLRDALDIIYVHAKGMYMETIWLSQPPLVVSKSIIGMLLWTQMSHLRMTLKKKMIFKWLITISLRNSLNKQSWSKNDFEETYRN